MYTILLLENGERVEAVVLATSKYRMRVVIRGSREATELRLLKNQWMSEEGDAVDIESLIVTAETSALGGHRFHTHAA